MDINEFRQETLTKEGPQRVKRPQPFISRICSLGKMIKDGQQRCQHPIILNNGMPQCFKLHLLDHFIQFHIPVSNGP